jgi:DnaB-like helicase C terminal domain/Toprim-like
MAEIGEIELTSYLSSHGEHTYRASGYEVTAHCFFCPDGNPKAKGKLYFNTESWLYDCKRCGTRGNRKTLLKHFGDTDLVEYQPHEDPSLKRKVLARAAELGAEGLLNNDAMLDYLTGRGLRAETIERYQLGYVGRNTSLCKSITLPGYERLPLSVFVAAGLMTAKGGEWLDGHITIPFHNHGTVVAIRSKDPKAKYFTAAGDEVRLYNSDVLAGADEVIITEGEFDTLVLQQALSDAAERGRPVPVVVAISGAQALPAGFEKYFVDARRVFVALDPDEEGLKATERICNLIGAKAFPIELPAEMPKCDWTEYLRSKSDDHPHGGHDWRDVMHLIDTARMASKKLHSIVEMAMKWRGAQDRGAGVMLGFSEFDSVIGGLQPGQLFVPAAKTGTGKSVFLANVVHNTAHRRTLLISLEMQSAEVFNLLRRIHFFHNPASNSQQILDDYSLLRAYDQNTLTHESFQLLVEEFIDDVGAPPELILLDYLGYYARGFRGATSYERTGEAAMSLKAMAKLCDAPMVVPAQVNRQAIEGSTFENSDLRDSGVVEETVDFLFKLYRPAQSKELRHTPDTSGELRGELGKSRHGYAGKIFNFRLSNMSQVIVEARNARDVHRIEQENALFAQGMKYDQYRQGAGQVQLSLVGSS